MLLLRFFGVWPAIAAFPSRAGRIGMSVASELWENRAIVEAAFACQRRLVERVNGPSTTTRNQINENSLVEENFLGGPLVVYCPRAAGYPDGKHPDRRLPEF
jgi:hypothetical protein